MSLINKCKKKMLYQDLFHNWIVTEVRNKFVNARTLLDYTNFQ